MSDETHRARTVVDGLLGPRRILSPTAPLESARCFIQLRHLHDDVRTIHHWSEDFHIWTGSHYRTATEEELRADIYQFLDTTLRIESGDKVVPFDPNRAKVADVFEALAAETQLHGDLHPPLWLGEDGEVPAREIIPCQNGLLHLPSRRLLSHSPAFFTWNAVDYSFDADAGEPVEWLRFLHTLWDDDHEQIDTLQEMFGYVLSADTKQQKAFLIIGPKRSGKGTIGRILTALVGVDNVRGPTLSSLAQNFGLASLIGKPLAIISDARLRREDQHIIAERLLAITGEDLLTIDRKYRGAWTGRLSTRFLILTNEIPRLSDASGALASRLIVLSLGRSFYGKEDMMLTKRLLCELPQILNWAIAGWSRLTERSHFVQPKSALQITEQLEDLGSPVAAFLRDCCIIDDHRCVGCQRLYDAWVKWCQLQGRDRPGTTQSFARDLRAAVPGLNTVQSRDEYGERNRYFQGLDLILDKSQLS